MTTFLEKNNSIMVLGTSSGAGKSLLTVAICRHLLRRGENPIPFKGQNMSNNAWVDINNCEMAYSQAVQAWASGLEPVCEMNPILLKPQGECISEVIHLGKSVGFSEASKYFEDWFSPGWDAIQKGLAYISTMHPTGRLILEGAGSPVEINLKHRDLTNLRLASHLNASCILVADIERGGVFAQIVGTLALLNQNEKKLIKGIIINRFRGDVSLFDEGSKWIEKKTGIPVLGIMPWLNELFPPEDSLDLLERKQTNTQTDLEIAVIHLPSLSNFSDLDPLEGEHSLKLKWIKPGSRLGEPDAVIIPGSKQTIKDLKILQSSGLANQIKVFANSGGNIFGICGGMQILGESLNDPLELESKSEECSFTTIKGLNLLPIRTFFNSEKLLKRKKTTSIWPKKLEVDGFELHHGITEPIESKSNEIKPIFLENGLGWRTIHESKFNIAGTYLHGLFENGSWRTHWINLLRKKKGLRTLPITTEHHCVKREGIINRLTDAFEEKIDLSPILGSKE